MPVSLNSFLKELEIFNRQRIVTHQGNLSNDFFRMVYRWIQQSEEDAAAAQAAADAAQTDATQGITDAATAQTQADYSAYQIQGQSAGWHTDATGTQPTNNSTIDLTATVYDEDGASVATRVLRGTYTTAADTIAVTAQSTTGETTTYSVASDATDTPTAIVTHTASGARGYLSWSFIDETVSGGVPISGGGK